jgi:SAM-dependent methyltransferase
MKGDAARRFFDAIAGRYQREYALPADQSRVRMEQVRRALPAPPARVLDLGVGTGRELTALLDAGYQPTGVDVSPAMLERCRRRARPVPLMLCDFWEPLPFADGSFDAAIALHGTLAHPPDHRALAHLARELARIVRPGGAFVAEVPAPAWIDRASGDPRVRRTGPDTAIYADPVTGAHIEARLLSDTGWTRALGPAWISRVEPTGEAEWLITAVSTGHARKPG